MDVPASCAAGAGGEWELPLLGAVPHQLTPRRCDRAAAALEVALAALPEDQPPADMGFAGYRGDDVLDGGVAVARVSGVSSRTSGASAG